MHSVLEVTLHPLEYNSQAEPLWNSGLRSRHFGLALDRTKHDDQR
jgi:hypothetical protein